MSDKAENKPSRGRYRKVEVRTWGDEKFRALSPIPPCGQGLWLFLITGPHTSPIPGLFRGGRAAMAEELGWDVEAFDIAFEEAFGQGMVKADFKARVVWLPSAIRHNKPESPNVVRSWAAEFDLIPECDLKREAYEALKASIHALGEAFGKAFDEAFSKPSGKAKAKTMANQEQEQEQEQYSPKAPKGGADDLFDTFWAVYPAKVGKESARRAFAKLNPDPALVAAMADALAWQSRTDKWTKNKGEFIPNPATWLNGHRWKDEPLRSAAPDDIFAGAL